MEEIMLLLGLPKICGKVAKFHDARHENMENDGQIQWWRDLQSRAALNYIIAARAKRRSKGFE
jgi:hypothetical protein